MGNTPSSRRRAATRATKKHQADTGKKYNAARQDATTKPRTVADVPPMTVPAPVAVMFARHIRAAMRHLSTAAQIGEDHEVPISRPSPHDPSPGPLHDAVDQARKRLWDLTDWAEATAVESGVIAAAPSRAFQRTPEQTAANRTLYPADLRWCDKPGNTLPQPGEARDDPYDDDAPPRIRYSLPGPVPGNRLVAYGGGLHVRKARDVVPGTPAADIWTAHEALYAYTCQWRNRPGDSPADLAAAVDGLHEIATALGAAANDILREVDRRLAAGTIDHVDRQHLDQVRTAITKTTIGPAGRIPPAASALDKLRTVLTGVTAALPNLPRPLYIPRSLAQKVTGWSIAQLRFDLHGSTEPLLLRMIQWCQATGRETYDPVAHAREDAGVTIGW